MPPYDEFRAINRRETDAKFETLRADVQRIQSDLSALISKVTEQTDRYREWNESLRESIEAHEKAVNGNNGTPGCKVRFTRLEDDAERRSWWGRAFGGALVVIVAERLWTLASALFHRQN